MAAHGGARLARSLSGSELLERSGSALTGPDFAAAMARLGPFGDAPALLAGVSGGPHSLALALLAAAWAGARGGSLLAVIVEHGLRRGSAAEAEVVRERLGAHGIEAVVVRLRLRPGAGLQARARAARLDALLAAARRTGRPWLLLGHHAGDQAETVLLRGLAGSTAIGLAGMPAVRATAAALILRPLLGVAPARLEASVAAAGLEPVRDPSNADPRFARARLRAAEPLAAPAVARAAGFLGGRRAARHAAIAACLAASATLHAEGDATLDLGTLGADAAADHALAALIRAVGGRPYPPSLAAVALLRRRGAGTLGGTWLRPAGTRHHLVREASAMAGPVPAVRGAVWDGRYRLDGPGDCGCTMGALGAVEARRFRGALPSVLLATLPAIRRHDVLVSVPTLGYPDPTACAAFACRFAPVAGPAIGAWDMALGPMPPHVADVAGEPGTRKRDRPT